jgi:HlyD family secretion protein
MNASVAFVSDEKPANTATPAKPVGLIPSSAVKEGAVFVLFEGKALKRAIKTGAASGPSVRVEQGLIGGEDLIVNPPSGLKEGDRVSPKS